MVRDSFGAKALSGGKQFRTPHRGERTAGIPDVETPLVPSHRPDEEQFAPLPGGEAERAVIADRDEVAEGTVVGHGGKRGGIPLR